MDSLITGTRHKSFPQTCGKTCGKLIKLWKTFFPQALGCLERTQPVENFFSTGNLIQVIRIFNLYMHTLISFQTYD